MILSKDIYYNAEVWTLILHILSLALLLFLFSPRLPVKRRRKSVFLADVLCSGTFLILLIVSASLILFPTNSLSIDASTVRISGQVEQMEQRNFIWDPSYTLNHHEYTGVYLHIDGEQYYCAVGEELQVGDSVELLRAEACDYVMRYTIVDAAEHNPTELSGPAWVLIARYAMLGTGAYLFVRTIYYLWQLFTARKKESST